MYKAVKIQRGNDGWGGPLIVRPTEKRHKIVSITGGGIDPLSLKIAKITGGVAVDGFCNEIPNDEITCVVINCQKTLRCGIYPKNDIKTVNIMPIGPSGPLAEYIREDNYVSGVVDSGITELVQ